MKKLLKNILSIEIMTVLMIFMAFACAVATFIENDYGTLGAKSFVYGQTWFETIMVLLTLGIVANIIWFKMYKTKKFFILFIHVSFIFILIGAGLTRYMGYEGIMTIPENTIQNRMLSNDEYIQAILYDKDGKEILKKDEKVLITQLSQTDFNIDINKDIKLSFEKFVSNAAEKIVTAQNGKPMVNLIITNLGGAKSIDLQNGKIHEEQYANFSLNKEIEDNSKPKVYFLNKDNQVFIKSNVGLTYTFMDNSGKGSINKDEALPLRDDVIYSVAQTRFATPDFSASGKIDVVSLPKESVEKDKSLNAVVTNLTYKGKTQKVALFGKGGANEGYSKTVKLDDKMIKLSWGAKIIELPFSLFLTDFKLERYPGSNSPSAYSSDVKVYDTKNDTTFEQTISMNNTLTYRGFKFFQSSYAMNETATILSVNKDPGTLPTYIGYFLLFTGLILSLFVKNGRFQKLARTKYELKNISAALIALLFIVSSDLHAKESITSQEMELIKNIDKRHSDKLGSVLIQDYQGRIKPINSLAIEIMNKVIRKESLHGLDANQLFISMMINPRLWQKLPIVKVSDENLKKVLGIEKSAKYFAFDDVYTNFGSYKLEDDLELANKKKPSDRNRYDKDLIKVDERLNIIYNHFSGAFLKLFPKIEDKNNKWLDPTLAISVIKDGIGALNEKEANAIATMMDNYFIALKEANEGKGTWDKASEKLDTIIAYQQVNGGKVLPSAWEIKAELMFNEFNIFQRLTPLYLILGLVLLGFVFGKIFKPTLDLQKITKIFMVLFILGFTIHTFGLALRWYVSGHAPWSNGYESMIYIAWAIVLSGMIFSRQSILALATTAVLSGVTLFVAHLSWLEPQITTLTPVLKSYWLTIHVSVITASYGFLGLSALLGFITLILYTIANKNKNDLRQESIKVSIQEARRINEMSIMIGLVLLVIGNFLGGVWANESWGRYWGWDPKETWTLVSILIYAVILHLHYIKAMATNYIFSALSLVSYASIIMTYFGVNYYLSGLHSYAAGDPLPIPTFVPVLSGVILVLIIISYRNRRII